MNSRWILNLIHHHKIVVLLGAGGVGKTSCSLGLAVMAARQGKKVGLLSIDPARRLAAALNLESGHVLKEVRFTDSLPVKGELYAAMLDPKEVFDSMVRRHAPDEATSEKILKHRLYVAASERLASAAEYMALAKLQDMSERGDYDLIILDTPPDHHALDFLSRPDILANFRDNKVMSWLIRPFYMASKFGVNRLFSVGEKLMGGLARVTGLEALRSLAEFLMLIQQVIVGFQSVGEKILLTLKNSSTAFLLVTSPRQGALWSAGRLADHLRQASYQLGGVLFNKSMPEALAQELAGFRQSGQKPHPWMEQLLQRLESERCLTEAFIREINSRNGSAETGFLSLPEQNECIHNQESLYHFSFAFFPGHNNPESKV